MILRGLVFLNKLASLGIARKNIEFEHLRIKNKERELLVFIDLVIVFLFLVLGFLLLVANARLAPRVTPLLVGIP